MKSPISVRKTNMCKFKGLKIRALDLGSFVRELVTFVKVTNWRCNRVCAVLVPTFRFSLAVKSTQVHHFDSNSLRHALLNDNVCSDMS